jgi:alpha-L-fucosidase 2
MGPTMDHQLIRDLFANTAEAARILETDEAFATELDETRARIAPNRIGKHGQLQEWLEDVDDPDNKHRHVSHLWGVFPGSEITPATPDLFEAAKQSLRMRGDEGTGWSLAWKVNLWARLLEGDKAYTILADLLRPEGTGGRRGGVYPNLFDSHPPFQIDGNFGATSGICQMLLHDYDGTVQLLPALPSAWPDGHVRGLRIRGGGEIDMQWENGYLSRFALRSTSSVPRTIRYHMPEGIRLPQVRTADGALVPVTISGEVVSFDATPGDYHLTARILDDGLGIENPR